MQGRLGGRVAPIIAGYLVIAAALWMLGLITPGLMLVLLVIFVGVAAVVTKRARPAAGALARPTGDTLPSTPIARSGIADDLAGLADLRDGGVLTEDEFRDEKAKLLGQQG